MDSATVSAMRLFAVIRAFVLCMWPASLWAAESMSGGLTSLSTPAWLSLVGLSTLGGVTALLFRINAQINSAVDANSPAPVPIHNLWVLALSQMLSSWLAGAIFLLIGMHFEWASALLGAAVAISSFGGAKSIEVAATWLNANKLGGVK